MSPLKHGIVGARGSMGKALRKLLSATSHSERESHSVALVDREWLPEETARVRECDVIWLAMPRCELGNVLQKLEPLQHSQLVIDLFSIKGEDSAERIICAGASYLSLHPMHGPDICWHRQKWFLIGRRRAVTGLAARVLDSLEALGIMFVDVDSREKHDAMMGVVLGIKELLTLVMDRALEAYAKSCGMPQPGIDELMKWASPVANAMYGAYVHSITSSSDALRAELVTAAPNHLAGSMAAALEALRKDIENISQAPPDTATQAFVALFETQRARVEVLPESQRRHIRKHINTWFEDSVADVGRQRRRAQLPIATERLTLRQFNEGDREELLRVLGDAETMKFLPEGPLTGARATEFIDSEFGAELPGIGVVCESGAGRVLGYAGIIPCKWPLEGELEFGAGLIERRTGYGRELGRKLIAIGLEKLQLSRLYALCHPDNQASINWLKALGMRDTALVVPHYYGVAKPRKVFVIDRDDWRGAPGPE